MFARSARSLFQRAPTHNLAASNAFTSNVRMIATQNGKGKDGKLLAPPMVVITGEEMTRYCMQLVLDKWIAPRVDTSNWNYFDLSCKNRDATEDEVLRLAVEAGKTMGAIFKEPTVTPTEVQKKELGLKKAWGSPNGAMRNGWNGITISRDTIHIEGMRLGFKRPVLFERQAVGGEYGAGWKPVGVGRVQTVFTPHQGVEQILVYQRDVTDDESVVVTYHNPLDRVPDLARIFYERCYEKKVTPYVVTKKTVFKWQEGFWVKMKKVFDEEYKEKFLAAGLLDNCRGELQHLISDAATMQIIRWTDGGFGMACHNYDGDMLTDEVAQIHRSPGFITSNLIGKDDKGNLIKEFEASHGTVTDMWEAHLRGEETSFNPLGMVEALIGAMQHAARDQSKADNARIHHFTDHLRKVIHRSFVMGKGTRDLVGPAGLTTEEFIDFIAPQLDRGFDVEALTAESVDPVPHGDEDETLMRALFDELDADGNGQVDFPEFITGLRQMGFVPRKLLGDEKAKKILHEISDSSSDSDDERRN